MQEIKKKVTVVRLKRLREKLGGVMECLEEVSPELRQDVIRLVNEKKNMRGVVTYG